MAANICRLDGGPSAYEQQDKGEDAVAITDIERLIAIEDIKQLRARFARFLDTKDWVGFAGVFTPDATLDARSEGEAGGLLTGPAAITDFIKTSLTGAVSVHHAHTPEITLSSPTNATGIWAMEDVLQWADDPAAAKARGFSRIHGYGHYHEVYEKVGGQWRVKSFTLTRLRVDIT